MVGSLLKIVAYSAAPRATFAVLHPRDAMRARRIRRRLHGLGPRAVALGVAALAIPVGMAVGRRIERQRARFIPSDIGRVPRLRVASSEPHVSRGGSHGGTAMRKGA